jgi:hypothetical protein
MHKANASSYTVKKPLEDPPPRVPEQGTPNLFASCTRPYLSPAINVRD